VTYGKPDLAPFDLSAKSDDELAALQLHKNDWLVRHARRLLQERAVAKTLSPQVRPALEKMFAEQEAVSKKLRALWALHAIGATDEANLLPVLDAKDEAVRVWAVRLLAEDRVPAPATLDRFSVAAKSDPGASVRLALAAGRGIGGARRRCRRPELAAHDLVRH
jgi:hypothetical protein